MNCFLCECPMRKSVSWRDLFCMDKKETACAACKALFEPIKTGGCKVCSNPGDGMCSDCRRWDETAEYCGVIDSGTCLFTYNHAMREYLHQFKFLQDIVLAEVFANELSTALSKTKAIVVPIPMNPTKLINRTFAQVDVMLDVAEIQYIHLLEKNEEIQGMKTREERVATRDLFTLNGNQVPQKIVLVDDMYTTGTTFRLAAKLLKEAGAEEVSCVALIRA